MHNIKDIRNNFDNFKNLIKSRNVSIDLDQITDLDKNNRNLIQKKEALEQEKKDISKKQDKTLFAKSKEISEKIIVISKEQSSIKNKLDDLLSSIPNLPLKDVPVGVDEEENQMDGVPVGADEEKSQMDGVPVGVDKEVGSSNATPAETNAPLIPFLTAGIV